MVMVDTWNKLREELGADGTPVVLLLNHLPELLRGYAVLVYVVPKSLVLQVTRPALRLHSTGGLGGLVERRERLHHMTKPTLSSLPVNVDEQLLRCRPLCQYWHTAKTTARSLLGLAELPLAPEIDVSHRTPDKPDVALGGLGRREHFGGAHLHLRSPLGT